MLPQESVHERLQLKQDRRLHGNGCLIGAIQYICTLTIISSKCSSQVLLINLQYSHWSKYIHNVSEKDLHGCLTLSAKSATSFPSVNNSSKFSSCMTEATMTSNASIILPEGDKWCLYAQCLCNYTADFNLANLEEVELVTLTGHIETLSIICTTSLVICSQK